MISYLLTICIVHFNKLPQLQKTVEHLKKNTNIPYKLKILNNGYEKNGIREYLERLNKEKNVEVIFNSKNVGCSPGRNILMCNINTPFIMSLDDDIYVSKNWDRPVFELFEKNKNVGAIGFSLYRPNGKFWVTGGRYISTNRNILNIKRPSIDPEKNKNLDFVRVDDISAGAMVYRNEMSNIITWDTGYFIGFDDLEKGLRLKKSKWKCFVSIQSKFIHDKISEKKGHVEYNKSRRDYHAHRRSYLHFIKRNHCRLDLKRHLFYKYVCLLPKPILQSIAYFWLGLKNTTKLFCIL